MLMPSHAGVNQHCVWGDPSRDSSELKCLVFQYKGGYWCREQGRSGVVLMMKEEKPTDVGTLGENNCRVCKLPSLTNASDTTPCHFPRPSNPDHGFRTKRWPLSLSHTHPLSECIQCHMAKGHRASWQQRYSREMEMLPGWCGAQPITGQDAVSASEINQLTFTDTIMHER